jgi:hypothetical protein
MKANTDSSRTGQGKNTLTLAERENAFGRIFMKLADMLATINAMGASIHADAETKGENPGTRKTLRAPGFAARRQLEALHNCTTFAEQGTPSNARFDGEGLKGFSALIGEAAGEAIQEAALASTPTLRDRLKAISASMRDQSRTIGTMLAIRFPAPAPETKPETKPEEKKTSKKAGKA